MIQIITRYEDTQMPPEVDRQIWRQLKGAFAVQRLVMVESDEEMKHAIALAHGQLVFLEPTGTHTVDEIPAGDVVLVLGNSAMNNLAFAQDFQTYRIDCVSQPTHLYGVCAAAIALEKIHGANR